MVEQNNIYMENTEKEVEGKGGVWYGDIVHARTDSHEGRRGPPGGRTETMLQNLRLITS